MNNYVQPENKMPIDRGDGEKRRPKRKIDETKCEMMIDHKMRCVDEVQIWIRWMMKLRRKRKEVAHSDTHKTRMEE